MKDRMNAFIFIFCWMKDRMNVYLSMTDSKDTYNLVNLSLSIAVINIFGENVNYIKSKMIQQ